MYKLPTVTKEKMKELHIYGYTDRQFFFFFSYMVLFFLRKVLYHSLPKITSIYYISYTDSITLIVVTTVLIIIVISIEEKFCYFF